MAENHFADNFDRLLGVHRLTARRAAELLNVSPSTLSHWINGRREPDVPSLQRVSAFFEVDPFEILLYPTAQFFMVNIANQDRFESVERRIAEGKPLTDLDVLGALRAANEAMLKETPSRHTRSLDAGLRKLQAVRDDEDK